MSDNKVYILSILGHHPNDVQYHLRVYDNIDAKTGQVFVSHDLKYVGQTLLTASEIISYNNTIVISREEAALLITTGQYHGK